MTDPTRLGAIYDEMAERCTQVWMFSANPDTVDRTAVGAMVLAETGDLLIVEVGVSADGESFVTVRTLDCEFNPKPPTVIATDETAMIVA